MKRITDYLADTMSLDNPAMLSYVMEEKTPEGEKDRIDAVRSIVAGRVTLDVTDLLPYFEHNDDIKISDIEGCIPPWPQTLVEYEVNDSTLIGRTLRSAVQGNLTRIGHMIMRLSVDQLCGLYLMSYQDNSRRVVSFSDISGREFSSDERYDILTQYGDYARHMAPEEVENVGWYLISYPFIVVNHKLFGPISESHLAVYRDGHVIKFPAQRGNPVLRNRGGSSELTAAEQGEEMLAFWDEWTNLASPGNFRNKQERISTRQAAMSFGAASIMPVLQAFSYANFRNIYTRAMDPTKERRPRQTQRHLERIGQVPTERYHVLEIGPLGARRANRVLLSEKLRSMPLHQARGHWAYYGNSPEHPYGRGLLFGKYEGRFWIDAHMRGSKSVGQVKKDYDLDKERVEAVQELTRGNIGG